MDFKKITDYSVSNEEFYLKYDSSLELYQTTFVDFENLNKYYKSQKYISHTDGKANWFEYIYQFIKKYTIRKKWRLIEKFFKNKQLNVLDIGCGTGDFLKHGLLSNHFVVGVEPNEDARKLAIAKGLQVHEDFNQIVYEKYDVITLWHVLEHVPDYENYLLEIKKMLKDEGILIIAVPNFKSYDAIYYKEFWAAWDVPRHLWHFSSHAIQQIAKKFHYDLLAVKPMLFDSFYVSLLSEEYKTGRKNIVAAFYRGFLSNIKAYNSKQYSSHIYILKNKSLKRDL